MKFSPTVFMLAAIHLCCVPTAAADNDMSLQIATLDVAFLTSTYVNAEKSCPGSLPAIEPSDIGNIPLTAEQLKTMLTYHAAKSQLQCSRQERSELIASAVALGLD